MLSQKLWGLKERLDYYKEDGSVVEKYEGEPDRVDDYLNKSDWRVRENANSGYCYQSCINHVAGTYIARHTLEKELPARLAMLHKTGAIHIHDLSNGIVGYCAGWSLMDLLVEGFHGGPGSARAKPARHFDTALSQLLNFFITLQGEWAGAQAISSFDTFLAPFVWSDNLTLKEVKQSIQRFIFMLNTGVRLGQTPFTNITLDWTVPEHLQSVPAVIGGEPHPEKTYGDFQKEVDIINRAFLEVMEAGDADGRIFTFPIPTYNITKDFDWDSDNAKYLFKVTGKYGTPYFANYINSSMDPKDIRSMAFLPEQKIIYKKNDVIYNDMIVHVVEDWMKNKSDIQVLMRGEFIPVKEMFKIPYDQYDKHIEITLKNGYRQSFSYAHKCYVYRDDRIQVVESQDVKPGDMFVIAQNPWGKPHSDNGEDDYLAGIAFATFLMFGHIYMDFDTGKDYVVYDIPKKLRNPIHNIIKFYSSHNISVTVDGKGELFSLTINNPDFHKYIDPYMETFGVLDTAFWNSSQDFRDGVWCGSVGSASDFGLHYSDVFKMLGLYEDDLLAFASSVGRTLLITRHGEEELFNNKFDVYEEFDDEEGSPSTDRRIYNGVDNDYSVYFSDHAEVYSHYIPVTGVEEIPTDTKFVYNFEIDSDAHLFELPNGIITHQCCRLRLELDKLEHRGGGLFGSGEKTGSIGVVTLNLPRLAYLASKEENKEEKFFDSLEDLIYDAITILEIKRKVVKENFERGLMPYSKVYLQTLDNHFSTIGTIGMNEMCLNLLGKDIGTTEGRDFSLKVLDFMNARLLDAQGVTSTHLNLEGVPGEGTSYRLAKQDKKYFPDIITSGEDEPYYTNSSYLPVNYTDDIFEVMDHQDDLQCKYTSGTVVHGFLGESVDDPEVMANLTRKVFSRYHFPYLTWTPTFSICPIHGYIHGKHETCPMDK